MMNVVCFDISKIDENYYQHLFSQASPDRRSRAERYPRREDKTRCVAADALIRYAVGQMLKISEFTVAQEADGKPYIVGREDFHFNLSHSGSWVVIAYGGSPVGVDVQQIRVSAEAENLARRFFTPEEQAFIFDADGDWENRFFQIWTAKESYLKYLGTGLRKPLNSFSVVPEGAHLGIRLNTTFLPGHCMTVCTQDAHTVISHLSVQELMNE